MDRITLALAPTTEDAFWRQWVQRMLWTEVAIIVFAFPQVLLVDLNVLGLFEWRLKETDPTLPYIMGFYLAVRALQLTCILKYRELYLRHALRFSIALKAYTGVFVVPCTVRAGVARKSFWEVEWLQGNEGGLELTSGSAIFKAIALPTGAICGFSDIIYQLSVPFRFLVPLQVLELGLLVKASWKPVTQLLRRFPKLTTDALYLCEAIREGSAMIIGFGGAVPQPQLLPNSCAVDFALSRLVLLTQMLAVVCLPLLAIYVVESEAKRAFLVRTGLAPAGRAAQRGTRWSMYLLALLGCAVGCELLVDVIHWLGLAPTLD